MGGVSKRPLKGRTIVFCIYVLAIFVMLPCGRTLAMVIRSHGVLTKGVSVLTGLVFGFFIKKSWPRLLLEPLKGLTLIILLITVIATIHVTLELPEERLHFAQYALLGYLSGWTLAGMRVHSSGRKRLALGFLITFFIGILDEIVQGILPMRFFDFHDIFWNVVSAWTGLLVFHFSCP